MRKSVSCHCLASPTPASFAGEKANSRFKSLNRCTGTWFSLNNFSTAVRNAAASLLMQTPFIKKTPNATIFRNEINGKFNPSYTLLPDASAVPNRFAEVFYESLGGRRGNLSGSLD